MQLSGEDSLRLNVMMAQDIQAVRIDENRMQVYGLTSDGEVRVDLNPAGKSEQYIKRVREFLSGHVFGSPGGYPVFISRWTRMGQAKAENLQKLLMLGEPEAVTAVVHAQGLTAEIGHLAWWCMPESESARRMLEKTAIAQSDLGPVLAGHLYEHLAFETEPQPMIDSVRLMLQPGLIDREKIEKLWRSGQLKNTYLVGFLQAMPQSLPHERAARSDYDEVLQAAIATGVAENPYMQQLLWWLSGPGQAYLDTVKTVLKKPSNQDVVVLLLNTMHQQLAACLPVDLQSAPEEIDELDARVTGLSGPGSSEFERADSAWQELLDSQPACIKDLQALSWLAQVSEKLVSGIFAQTTAVGTLMRKKLMPVTTPIFERIDGLLAPRDNDI